MSGKKHSLGWSIAFSLLLHGSAIGFVFSAVQLPVVTPRQMIMVSIVSTHADPPSTHEPEQAQKTRIKPQKQPQTAAEPLLPVTERVATLVENSSRTTVLAPTALASVEAPREVMQPRFDAAYLNNAAPSYPPTARRRGEQGKVLLHVLVKSDGSAGLVEIRSSSGSSALDLAALEAVKRWHFIPARVGNDNIESSVLVPLTFHLEN